MHSAIGATRGRGFISSVWVLQQAHSCLGQVCSTWNIVLNEEPRAWATLSLDDLLPTTELISAWIKKSNVTPTGCVYFAQLRAAQQRGLTLSNSSIKNFWQIWVLQFLLGYDLGHMAGMSIISHQCTNSCSHDKEAHSPY